MESPSSSSIEEFKSVKERSAKRAKASKRSKDSDKKAEQSLIDVEASVHHGDANESEQSLIADNTSDTVREDQTFGQDKLKDVNEYLKGKVGPDINAKKWLEGCEGLDDLEKSEVVIRLVYEVCLAKNIEYDLMMDQPVVRLVLIDVPSVIKRGRESRVRVQLGKRILVGLGSR